MLDTQKAGCVRWDMQDVPPSQVRILLVRHGESEGNVDPAVYLKKGDSKLGLTERGWRQVARTGEFLSGYYREIGLERWPHVHVSPHQRTLESLSGIVHGIGPLFEGAPKIDPQSFLTERFFGAASALEFIDDTLVPRMFRDNIALLSKAVYDNDPFSARHLFGESPKDTMIAAKLLMEGTVQRDVDEGKRDILIVCHGAVIQSILMNRLHVLPADRHRIGNPGNGDVIEMCGTPKNWRYTRLWDGENGVRVAEDYRARVKRFTAADLPPVPDFLKDLKP